MLTPVQLYWPPGPTVLGRGKRLSSFCPLGSIRFAGTMLPGTGVRVVGSRIVTPDCEKLPLRSSAVGNVFVLAVVGMVSGRKSCDQKKNNLSRFRLKRIPGSSTGPPTK